ncbi:sugar transferase [Clostridium sp. AF32-12BH]|uniref:sugar transferase n=1 Tax=Clostridium sp. AF32-12BH TaxID=2292006 RepID=UPI000E546251|nr:sugar transferase [Clostridium sp. AF32-12BH]RHP47299.1 sugar transferase [Clostridium sp. AF32-12BH]
MYQKRKNLENTLILLLDVAAVLVSSLCAFWLRFHRLWGIAIHGDQAWQIVYLCLLVVLTDIFLDLNHHFFERGKLVELFSVIRQAVIYSVAWIAILYVMHITDRLSRLVFGYFIVTNTVLTYVLHICFKEYMTHVFKFSRYSSRLLLITTSKRLDAILKNMEEQSEWNRVLTGIVLLDHSGTGEKIGSYPVVADRTTAMDYIVHNDIDEVFIACPDFVDYPEMKEWVSEMELMGIIVDVNIDAFDLVNSGNKTLNRVGKYAVVTFARNIISTRGLIMKRALDIVGGLVGMLILCVATIFVAPAIKLESPGPVFFGQTRIGKNGRRFTFYKFRSMYQDAEQRKKELMAQNEVKGLMFKMENDPRITKVGRFIRKTSIDELPQFWNVLRGDMSLVGTRPPTVDEFERYEAKHKCRLSMTPGLTGMWQTSGRSDIKDFDEVVQLDMEYIDNWTILKDIKILFKTVAVVFFGKGSR